ncbi:MAG: hypothetical protein HUJ57_05465 [Erysipelotrichaceae bacterium]|nr:hypothetical protein [Erysipelotrichaceae bacterium]
MHGNTDILMIAACIGMIGFVLYYRYNNRRNEKKMEEKIRARQEKLKQKDE